MYVVTIFPYVMMTILLINVCLLDGASDGIKYYLSPDFDRLADGAVSFALKYNWFKDHI